MSLYWVVDPAAGGEVALDHAPAVQLQNARVGKAAAQRLAHTGGIDPGGAGQRQALGHGADGQPDDDLIGGLGHLSGPDIADMGQAPAQHRQQRDGCARRRRAAPPAMMLSVPVSAPT